jgi:hypothetical protein
MLKKLPLSTVSGLLSVLALAMFPLTSHAYTECAGLMLTKVFTETDGEFFIATGGTLNGYIHKNNASYKTAVAIALMARATGTPVTIRYLNDGIVCGSASWNQQIIGIGT